MRWHLSHRADRAALPIADRHYNRQKVFVLRFMTHAEYDKDRWKKEL